MTFSSNRNLIRWIIIFSSFIIVSLILWNTYVFFMLFMHFNHFVFFTQKSPQRPQNHCPDPSGDSLLAVLTPFGRHFGSPGGPKEPQSLNFDVILVPKLAPGAQNLSKMCRKTIANGSETDPK